MDRQQLIEAAIEWAENGIPVFPCGGNKRPLTTNGHLDATTDPDLIREMFASAGSREVMIGARMGKDSGLFCVDIDTYKLNGSQEWLDRMNSLKALPPTRTHRTKNGGEHRFYRSDKEWPNMKAASAIDIKGEGGYVILPPSAGYEEISTGVVEAPRSLMRALKERKTKAAADTMADLRARILDGSDFHDSLTRIAAKLSGGGSTRAEVIAALLEALQGSIAQSNNHPRHERWKALVEDKDGELSRIVGTGHDKYSSAAAGEQAEGLFTDEMRKASEAFGFASPQGGEEPEPEPILSVEQLLEAGFPFEGQGYFAHEEHDLLSQKFVMYPLLCEDESLLMSADPKAGKTALALTAGLHIACGIDLGQSLRIAEPRGVLYFGFEGRRAIKLRTTAWKRRMTEDGYILPENIPFFVLERSKNLMDEETKKQLVNQIIATDLWMQQNQGVKLGAIFVDTYTKAMTGGDQNSVQDTSQVFELVAMLRDVGVTACVVFIHHNSKQGQSRGSSNIEADPDVLTKVRKNGPNVEWVLERARSVEEGATYKFTLHNYHIGTSEQGFSIDAPFVEATDAFEADNDFGAAQGIKAVMDAIISLGNGKHHLDGLIPVAEEHGAVFRSQVSRRARTKTRVRHDDQLVQAYFADLIPPTGYAYAGKTVERVLDAMNTITHLLVR